MEAKTLLCIACGGGHCDDKVRCRPGSSAEEAKSAGSKAKLADEDGRGFGIVGWLVRVVRMVDMMLSMLDVRGPFHSSHLGLGSLIGRLWRMSDARRCGSFCMRHCENRRSCVCSSVMEVVRDRDRKKLNSEVRVR